MKKIKNLTLSIFALMGAFLLLFPSQLMIEAEDNIQHIEMKQLVTPVLQLDSVDLILP